jgi:sodium transport system permease protein
MTPALLRTAWAVFRKELVDALRDRRTLLTVFLSSVAMGPLVLVLISTLVSEMEERAEARELVAVGLDQAPTLRNYLLRQTYTLKAAPPDYEQQLQSSHLGDPVLVVPADFEAQLARGEVPRLALVSSSANQRAQGGVGRIARLLQGFNQEQATLRLAVRGVGPQSLQVVEVDELDLASPASRVALLTAMLPFFVLMAVLYGALNAALDTTAGERERGSLEPLLMNPAPRLALVLGKWGAVAVVGMLIAVLSSFSFLPGQWLLRSETLAAMFQYGPAEALAFLALLLPLAGGLSALLMAVAIRCRSFKEAQANATVIVLAVSMLPMVNLFSQEGEKPWHLWVPALAQSTLMGRVLKGEPIATGELLVAAAGCTVLAVLCLGDLARQFAKAAVR